MEADLRNAVEVIRAQMEEEVLVGREQGVAGSAVISWGLERTQLS